jgi:hypothetical protein
LDKLFLAATFIIKFYFEERKSSTFEIRTIGDATKAS